MNPFIKLLSFISLYLLFFSIRAEAQVTIGSATPPAPGALLQLKNADLADNANATKGLGMPRVALTDIDELNPAVDTKSMTPVDAEAAKKAHIGLLVYNLTTNGAEGELDQAGIYVWDGEIWTLVKKKKRETRGG